MTPLDRIKKDIRRKIRKSGAELIGVARDLIGIPSENTPPGGHEKKAQQYLKIFLDRAGIKNKFVDLDKVPGLARHAAFYPGRNYHDRPNLIARWPGKGNGKSLLFSGHVDTMPVGSAPWKHEPLGKEISGDKLYGRGAYDMKGGLAAMVMALKTLVASGVELEGDLLFESVVDEEHAGCNGTLANRLAGHNADAAILAEPSNQVIYPAHKGFRIAHLTISGNSGMPFAGETLENPVEHVGRLIECIKLFREKRRAETKIPAVYRYAKDPVPVFMPKLQAGEFSYRIPMTIPAACKLEVYWQTMPGETRASVEKEFLAFLREWSKSDAFFRKHPLKLEFSHRWMPGTEIDRRHPVVKLVRKNARETLGRDIKVEGAPYPCDLFIFNLYGRMPGIVFGPRGGNAHGADEFVYIGDLIQLAEIFSCAALEWCGVK